MFRRLNPRSAAVFIYCALAFCFCMRVAQAEESVSVEYKIKAAYLLNFAKFVEWPTNRFPTPTTPIRVGVIGKDPFGSDLERTIGGRVIEGRKCEILRTDDAEAALSCHIVFISSSERRQLPDVLEKLHRGHVLTVGQSEQFTEEGGIIQFY